MSKLSEIARTLIETSDGDLVSSVIAARICDDYPSAVDEWLVESRAALVTDYVTKMLGSDRARATRTAQVDRLRAPQRAFAEAAAAGDDDRLSAFDITYVIDDEFTRRRLGDMTQVDCLYVADRYGSEAAKLRFEEAVMRVIAKRCTGEKRVRDVLTLEQYEAIRKGATTATHAA